MLEETWLKELSDFNFDHKTVTYLKYKDISQWKVVSNQKINHYLKSSEKFFDVAMTVELCKPSGLIQHEMFCLKKVLTI